MLTTPLPGQFVGPEGLADVAVLIVTYQSARDVATLVTSLRAETASQRLRVVVADNASTDGTLAALRAHPDVIVCPTGGNLGYAAGINVAARAAGQADALLVVNPRPQGRARLHRDPPKAEAARRGRRRRPANP